jgi:hypothetical protein
MRSFMKFLLSLIVLALLVAGGAWLWAGRAEGPSIEIRQPDKFIGQATPLDMVVESPGGQFARIDAAIEQNGQSYTVFALAQPSQATVRQESADRIFVMRSIGKRDAAGRQREARRPGSPPRAVRLPRSRLRGLARRGSAP